MRLLMLGGGVFLGAAVLGNALRRGHTVTVFNRGRTRSVWPAGVEVLSGDRSADLPALAQQAEARWDAVIDTCGYVPDDLHASVEALQGVRRYLFISSVSAYASFAHAPVIETDNLGSAAGLDASDRSPEHYGPQKAACEAVVSARLGERALIVRPGLIVGPGDPTGRFSHWPWRVAEGGEVLVPGIDSGVPLQFIDVRDLAEWMLHLLEQRCSGIFNATGPASSPPCDWGSLLQACVDAAAERGALAAQLVRVAEDFLVGNGVQAWNELPLWVPATDASMLGFMHISLRRAEAHGLRTRPLQETVSAVLDEGVPPADDKRRKGKLARQREGELIALWRASRSATKP